MSTIQQRLRERKVKAKIHLAHRPGPGLGLIVLQPSGALYTNTTGGYGCHPEQAEGVFVPLIRDTEKDQECLLIAYFTGPKWDGWCSDGIDHQTADYVDYVLSLLPRTNYLSVDRTRLADSKEAWIFVYVHEPTEFPEVAPISGFGQCKGILTWGNSD